MAGEGFQSPRRCSVGEVVGWGLRGTLGCSMPALQGLCGGHGSDAGALGQPPVAVSLQRSRLIVYWSRLSCIG